MNAWFILFLKIWGISSIITVLGCFLEPRLKYPDNKAPSKNTIQDCALYLVFAPFSAFIMIIAFICYLCDWIMFFWKRIKDIKI